MAEHPSSITTVFLDQPPSCLQFCPSAPNSFIVGTYLLSEHQDDEGKAQQSKTGSLQLWRLDEDKNTLSLINRVSLPYAVFDLHFHPTDPSLLAIATSAGSVALFRVSGPTPTEVTHVWTRPAHNDSSVPALFLAWTPQHWLTHDQTDGFAVTFSDGTTSVFKSGEGTTVEEKWGNELKELGSFPAKQAIEVWFVALAAVPDESQSQSSLTPFLFTGNDFGSLHTRRFETTTSERLESEPTELLSPVLLDHDDRARHHTAGVTAILPLPIPLVGGAPWLLTGSYDEYLRVYHATRTGQVLAEVGLGGGVWRLQMLRTEHEPIDGRDRWTFLVLASCMHAGTRVVRVTGHIEDSHSQWDVEVLAEFTEHESMNYASDVWKPNGGYDLQGQKISELLCVSSSFYDRRVCLWRART
ncbi:hypothetical protein EYZ11_004013 [Aspergillus tanneri]|uniref:Diphthine methyltransferase n=1 Tax=Aspergillus tanneri TaxID=1220188 RepID=A0A4V3UPU4_9EURO|nr:uncharacterized protein ATNIH1004_007408 [Aspergillus tanneri]KAA8645987.1 hypothetical protein ATNIH1004_007408 [Aspergillus tanneri]THC96514.1 hypothetical protein EYZ11_004013 [Aspergillus tanneri]